MRTISDYLERIWLIKTIMDFRYEVSLLQGSKFVIGIFVFIIQVDPTEGSQDEFQTHKLHLVRLRHKICYKRFDLILFFEMAVGLIRLFGRIVERGHRHWAQL